MKNFAQIHAEHLAAFDEMKAKFGEEYYALRKCAAEIIMHGSMKAIRNTSRFKVGIKVLEYPTLFMKDAYNEYAFQMTELEGYFQYGHIASGLDKYQLDDAMHTAFKSINVFLQQFK